MKVATQYKGRVYEGNTWDEAVICGQWETMTVFPICSIQPSLNYERDEFTAEFLGKEFNNFI